MICKNCGKKILNNSDICPECGGNLRPNVPRANAKSAIMKEETDHAIIWYIKKKTVYTVLTALVVAVVGIGLLKTALSFFNRIDFTQYVLVEVTGYNGQGLLDVQIDTTGLSKKLFDKTPDAIDNTERQMLTRVAQLLQNGIEVEGTNSRYSNGEKIILRVTNLETLSEVVDQKCKQKDNIIYAVEGLKEVTAVTFEDMFDVSFTGFNGGGCVQITPKATDLPWNIACSDYEVYIDGTAYVASSQTGNLGALSNGDTVTIGLIPGWEDNTETLLDTYGMCVSSEEASYTVSGLSEPQNVDVMSMVEVMFNGVEGSVELGYRWNREEYQQGNVRIIPRDGQSNSFNMVVSGVPSVGGGIVFLSESGNHSTLDWDLGQFYLTADKDRDISAGDRVVVTLHSDRFDSLNDNSLSFYGIRISSLEKTISVDAAMIPRLVTSLDQVNQQNLSPLAFDLRDSVMEALEKDWSYIVHGNRNYVCYDQTVLGGPEELEAHLVCTDTRSNYYSIWIIYIVAVIDSELNEEQLIFSTVRLDRPVIFQDENKTVDYAGSMQMEFWQTADFVNDSWWYDNENSKTIVF